MLLKRIATLIVFVVAASLSLITVVSAGAVEKFYDPVSFTLTPDTCPDVDTEISGAGEYFVRVNERVMRDGSTHLIVNVTVAGTATDLDRNTYRFNYHNTFHGTVPAGAEQFIMRTTDHFNLVGAGGENKVHVGFVTDLTFADLEAGPIGFDDINVRGTVSCDPI
jgi:hypothetical protein